jgi:hypothetical protein
MKPIQQNVIPDVRAIAGPKRHATQAAAASSPPHQTIAASPPEWPAPATAARLCWLFRMPTISSFEHDVRTE